MMLLSQTTELIKEGQDFASRFGYEALLVVVFFAFILGMLWKFGGRLIDAVASYIQVTADQMIVLTAHQSKISEQQVELSNAIASGAVDANAQIAKIINALKLAILATEQALPPDKIDLKARLVHIVAVLDEK